MNWEMEGSLNPVKGSLVNVGITPRPSHRLGMDEAEKEKKEQKEMVKNDNGIVKGEKGKDEKEREISLGRKIGNGLLLVVSAKIYGEIVKALIDSRATRCFVTPTYGNLCGLKAKP